MHRHVKPARRFCVHAPAKLSTGVAELDTLFGQAARPGKIIEWGMPQGKNGRLIPLLFLRNKKSPAIWIYGDRNLHVYAPAWAGYGVDLQQLFFIYSSDPVKQLRPLFLDNSFRIIVIDGPEKMSRGALAFVSSQARINGQMIFLLRNYFLSRNNGTAQAALRVNCWQNRQGRHSVNVIKGQYIKKIQLDMSSILPHE